MRILITGATGFVGKCFVRSISRVQDMELMLLSRNFIKTKSLFENLDCELVSIENTERIKEFNPEIVFHLASKVTSLNSVEVIDELIDSNILLGVKLLDVLRGCDATKLLVNFGTFSEYRHGEDSVNSAYLYAATKTAFRSFLNYYSELSGYKYIHVVPYTIYGGEDTAKKIIDHIKDSFTTLEPIKMSGGEQILDFIHVQDIVSFMNYILSDFEKFNQLSNGETIHLGTGRGTSIKELAAMMEEHFGLKANIEWGALPYRERDVMRAIAPVDKLRMLGWRHQFSIENYIEYTR